ncbi:MAG: hypothetical protein IKK08_02850 [Clostridia bacterium]|nr:hypothetical protein [Clostridia bacterium]
MNHEKMREHVHTGIDRQCASLTSDPYRVQRVLNKAHETPKTGGFVVKKKLSVGMVFAIVLILMTVTAVAAVLLSMRQIVDDYAVPMAQQSVGEIDYNPEEVSILVQLAQENGIVFSEHAMSNIAWAESHGEGYAKDEFIKLLAYTEFGEDISTWTLEQQKWFDDALVAMGIFPESQKAMPKDPEGEQELAVSRAVAHLTANYSIAGDIMDESQYQVGVQYINGDADGDYPGLYWSIDFQPKTITGGEYWVYLRDNGEILGQSVRLGLSADSSVGDVRDAYVRYYKKDYPAHVEWDQHVYQEFLATAKLVKPSNGRAYLCIIQTEYPDIPDDAISFDDAYAIAAADLGITDYRVFKKVLIATDTNPVWKFTMSRGEDDYSFEIDCITGEIRTKRLLDNLHRKWWMSIVLWEVSDEVDANWVDDSPSFG